MLEQCSVLLQAESWHGSSHLQWARLNSLLRRVRTNLQETEQTQARLKLSCCHGFTSAAWHNCGSPTCDRKGNKTADRKNAWKGEEIGFKERAWKCTGRGNHCEAICLKDVDIKELQISRYFETSLQPILFFKWLLKNCYIWCHWLNRNTSKRDKSFSISKFR